MAELIINLTLALIHEKIEKVLDEHCNYFYQQAFSLPDLRQELLTYVLSRINISYIAIEEGKHQSIQSNKLDQLLAKRLDLEAVIEEGIDDILPQKNKWEQHIFE